MTEAPKKVLMEMYRLLSLAFGPQGWWPTEDPGSPHAPFEVAIGAILTQNTNWKNVELALSNLKEENVLTPAGIDSLAEEALEALIRPSGYFRVKAKRLKTYVSYLMNRYGGDMEASLADDVETLRDELLSLKGIGPETADSILLYAGGKPSFVVDAYTKRVLARHGIADEKASYDELRSLFMENLPRDVSLYNEFHALLVAVGKKYCRPKAALCEECPLSGLRYRKRF
jgi:endonuclease-3 related protein